MAWGTAAAALSERMIHRRESKEGFMREGAKL